MRKNLSLETKITELEVFELQLIGIIKRID